MPTHSQHSAKVAEIVATAARTVQARSLAVRRSGAELFVRASRTPVPAVKYFLPAPCLRAVAPIGWYSLAVPSVSAALNSGREDKYGFHVMKGTERFKQRIQTYLEELSGADSRFSVKFRNPRKNIDDCITYILNCVKQSECAGFEDDEIFGMAIHYYSEENIDVGKPLTCDVRIDHVVELTEEEKAQARQAAMERAEREAYAKLTQPKKKRPAIPSEHTGNVEQTSLF